MKIIAISDLHGNLPEIDNQGDVLCICGDIVPLKMQENRTQCKVWIFNKFIPWCKTINCKEILLIAGSHDLFMEKTLHHDIISWFSGTNIHYLENDLIEIDGIKFFGTPYCHEFGNWAFMRSDDNLKMIYDIIPENVDVLLTHDAPYGTSDICLQETIWTTGEHIGCKPLRDAIIEKSPKVVLHGHLHSTNHNVELLKDTEVYNVSLLDEGYELIYKPLILEL